MPSTQPVNEVKGPGPSRRRCLPPPFIHGSLRSWVWSKALTGADDLSKRPMLGDFHPTFRDPQKTK